MAYAFELSRAENDVIAERRRQIDEEGFTAEHDDFEGVSKIAQAGACYGLYDTPNHISPGSLWPWDWKWWKPTTVRRNLVKGAALFISAIEVLDRAEKK